MRLRRIAPRPESTSAVSGRSTHTQGGARAFGDHGTLQDGRASSAWPGGWLVTDTLRGVRVLDLTRMLAGPYATMLLADMGAEVIKVEEPAGDPIRRMGPPFEPDGRSPYFMAVNRNKKSVTLDLRLHADPARLLTL